MGKRKQVIEVGPAKLDLGEVRSAAADLGKALTEQAKVVGAKAGELAQDAGKWAEPKLKDAQKWAEPKLKDAEKWAEPKLKDAKNWAGPKVEKARREVVKAAAPRLEAAAASGVGLVDAASHKLSDDVLPRIQKAMHEAAAAVQDVEVPKGRRAGKKARKAARKAEKNLQKAVRAAEREVDKPRRGRRTLGWMVVGSAAAGAGYLLWRRSQPVEDPWAEEYWQNVDVPPAGEVVDEVKDFADDAGDVAEQKFDEAVDAADDAVDEAGDFLKDVGEEAEHRVDEAVDAVEDKTN
ncbi:MAG TPA: hypothetical protein GX743_09415 [Actinomycetales bacterium]|nr:hypothetical protein [Actinomycetales bacterium]